ncbi:MAG: hypothetical protein JWM41_3499 [Gemmatimonadetes bacterium]|nr:hypothetical protein [Gemmatimonadota bacterium]
MTTPSTRSLVSLAAALTLALASGGCASAPSRLPLDRPSPAAEAAVTVQFDNAARNYVHVYLVGEQREWLLGRVEPGARATLRIPEAALTENAGAMRLAVLEGQSISQRVAGDARASTTIKQPVGALLSLHWTFSHELATGELMARQRDPLSR